MVCRPGERNIDSCGKHRKMPQVETSPGVNYELQFNAHSLRRLSRILTTLTAHGDGFRMFQIFTASYIFSLCLG